MPPTACFPDPLFLQMSRQGSLLGPLRAATPGRAVGMTAPHALLMWMMVGGTESASLGESAAWVRAVGGVTQTGTGPTTTGKGGRLSDTGA
jgi:hypothetical protein